MTGKALLLVFLSPICSLGLLSKAWSPPSCCDRVYAPISGRGSPLGTSKSDESLSRSSDVSKIGEGDETASPETSAIESSLPGIQTRDPTPQEIMRALGTSPRRIFLGNLAAIGIALAGNFLGVTSKLLTALPEDSVEMTGLDTYYPRGDFKRVNGEGYSFVIPKEWVADTFVALARAQRKAGSMELNTPRRRPEVLPDEAFGPPGRLNKNGMSEQGDTNVSLVMSRNLRSFSLRGTLGGPTEAAETLLKVSLAPEGSGRVGKLLAAREDRSRGVYQFEYEIDRGATGPPLRALSVIAERRGSILITMTVVAPKSDWQDDGYAAKLTKVADSFHLT